MTGYSVVLINAFLDILQEPVIKTLRLKNAKTETKAETKVIFNLFGHAV